MSSRTADDIQVMVLGKPGVGKSTLANGLMGKNIARISAPGAVVCAGVTRAVESYEFAHNGVRAVIWDTPGLGDTTLSEDHVLRDISRVYNDIDLFLFCIRMPDKRLTPGDDNSKIIKLLEKKFKKDIWRRTLVVLVFANELVASLQTELLTKDKDITQLVASTFESNRRQWESIMRKELGQFLGVVPTGHVNRPKLLKTDEERWLNKFWEKCLRSLHTQEKQAALLKLNEDRLTDDPRVNAVSVEKKTLAEQYIFASRSIKEFISVLGKRFVSALSSLRSTFLGY